MDPVDTSSIQVMACRRKGRQTITLTNNVPYHWRKCVSPVFNLSTVAALAVKYARIETVSSSFPNNYPTYIKSRANYRDLLPEATDALINRIMDIHNSIYG